MHNLKLLIWIFVLMAMAGLTYAQEFPIAVGNDDTFAAGGATDGTKFLVLLQGDAQNKYNLTAQFMTAGGVLSGPRFSLGKTGSAPVLAFDGTNYLMAWSDIFPRMAGGDTNGISDIHAQFISSSGDLAGPTFTIVTSANIRFGQGRGGLLFHDSTYFLVYAKGGNHTDYLYGQRIDRSGNLLGAPIQISSQHARECAIAFDGTNYLVAWCEVAYPAVDRDIYGQFVSTSGSLVGGNFLIDGSPNASDNPVTMIFANSKYWVAFHEQAGDGSGRWNLYGRFVSTSGGIAARFTICDSSKSPSYATAAFDGRNYLFAWMEMGGSPRIRGRFFNATAAPIAPAFTAFDSLGGKFPIGGVSSFENGHFLLSATRVDINFANGDVYGLFLDASPTGVAGDGSNQAPQMFVLSQNYPNPFNPSTTIRYGLPHRSVVLLTVYNSLGQQVALLVEGEQEAGYHEVRFYGSGLSSGLYFYRLTAGSFVQTRKLILLQ